MARAPRRRIATIAIVVVIFFAIPAVLVIARPALIRHFAKSSSQAVASASPQAQRPTDAKVSTEQLARFKSEVRDYTEANFEAAFAGFTSDRKVKLDLLRLLRHNGEFAHLNPGISETAIRQNRSAFSGIIVPARIDLVVELNQYCVDRGTNPAAPTYQLAVTTKPVTIKDLSAVYAKIPCVRHVFLNGAIWMSAASAKLSLHRLAGSSPARSPASVHKDIVIPEIVRLTPTVSRIAIDIAAARVPNPKALVELQIALIGRDQRLKAVHDNWFSGKKIGEIADPGTNSKILRSRDRSVRISRVEYPLEVERSREIAELNNLIIRAVRDGARLVVIPPVELSSVYTAVTFAAINKVQVATP